MTLENAPPKKILKPRKTIEPASAENGLFEVIKTIAIALVVAVTIRTVAYEPFSIPSGSMIPTMLVGDYLFVSKYSYGYSQYSLPFRLVNFPGRLLYKQPKRGDVAVFKKPTNPSIDYIKRIIGLPGDTIRMIEGRLYINQELVERQLVDSYPLQDPFDIETIYNQYIETLPNGVQHQIIERSDNDHLDNTIAYTVPHNSFFVMGDNRDGSQDSRVMSQVGFIPYENLVGRAEVIFFSVSDGAKAWEFWKWPWTLRFNRIFKKIH